jgi:hypothetical protein
MSYTRFGGIRMARRFFWFPVVAGVLAFVAPSVPVSAQAGGAALGSVTLPRAVMANGQSLPAGTYTVRVSTQAVPQVVGLSAEATTWLEFVRGGEVRGRELASVLMGDAVRQVAKGPAPASGSAKVERLKGDDYLRVWINRGGTHYLVHFQISAAR